MWSPPLAAVLVLVLALGRSTVIHSQDTTALHDPWDAVYTECLSSWSLPCIQRKLLLFVDRVGRLKKFSLLGDAVSVVRIGGDPGPPITEDGLRARLLPGQEGAVGALLQHSFFNFLDSHVLRVSLPSGVSVSSGSRALSDTLEINLGRALAEARGKKKKQMVMMGAMLMTKAMMLGKMMVMLIKFKAIKALLLSIVALALAKIQLFKSLKNSGGKGGGKETYIIIKGGGKGGGHGSGGGGYSSGGTSGGGGWSDSGASGGGWSSGGGGGGSGGWQSDSGGGGGGGGGGGWASSGSGGSGGWSSGGSSGGASGWSGGGGGSGGWGRNYDASWLAYRAHAPFNKTDSL